MMKKFLTMLAMAALCCMVGCNDDVDELEKEIDSLKSRVEALEKQVTLLNSNIEALQALSQKGATITEVKCENGTYTITLSNGEVITLAQGSEAEAVIPVIAINEQGYWVVDYRDGAGFVEILVNGEPVKATADDGITPLFKIDADGFWTVSYDGGKSYERVLDVNGQPVNATGTGELTDKFFEEVKVEGDLFYVKLLTGEELRIPILADFFCHIIAPEGVQLFTSKQTQRYSVEIRGVENVFLSAPTGWSAELTDPVDERATLIVTAPETSATRSLADNTKDVTILAMAGYYATIAKIQVEVEGSIVVTPPTVESVTLVEGSATESSLSFTVTTSEDTDAWMYLLQPASEAAPEASTIASVGKVGVNNDLTVAGLESDTEYALYVIAVKNPNTYSEVFVAKAKTNAPKPDYTDYYEEGVTIDGVSFSKENGTLITATTLISEEGVYFIDPAEGQEITLAANGDLGLGKLVIIGRYSNKMPVVKITNIVTMNAKSSTDGFIFKNIDFDASSFTNYIFNFAGTMGQFERFVMEDCHFTSGKDKPMSYFNNASGIKRIILRNSKVALNMSTNDKQGNLFNLAAKCDVSQLSHFVVENNVIYCPEGVVSNSMILNLTTNALPNLVVNITGNTLVNFAGKSNGYVNCGGVAEINISKNIMWIDPSSTVSCYLCKISAASETVLNVADNVAYGLSEKGKWSSHTGTLPTGLDAKPAMNVVETSPFTSMDFSKGSFIPTTDYAAYGSTLQ